MLRLRERVADAPVGADRRIDGARIEFARA
jgi:hypothetical protein